MARKLVFDRLLFATVLVLPLLGLVMVSSATAPMVRSSESGFFLANPLLIKQCVAAVIGLLGMLVVMHIDYRMLKRPSVIYTGLAFTVVLLIAVLFGSEINGSRRWLRFLGLSFQPSEFAKLVVVAYVAYQIERKRERVGHYVFLLPVLGLTGFLGLLILAGKDLGTTALLCLPVALMIFLAGVPMRWAITGGLVVVPMVALAIASQEYRRRRLLAFLDPEADPLGTGFQLLQSLIAVGSGGLFGLGPGGSVQKLHFLPSPHADFVFSIVAEELGFFGSVVLIGLFGVLLWRGVVAGQQAPEAFGRFMAWGLTALLVGQALVHMSVALGVMPTTGVPLPFISHGGSSLIASMVAAGLILNVSQHGSGR